MTDSPEAAGTWVRTQIAQEPREAQDPAGTVGWLHVLCRATARALPAAGVAVSVSTDEGDRALVAASDDATARVDELQFTLGEGPCRDAFTSNGPVLVPDLSEPSVLARWPGYEQEVREHGVEAVFAFPLHSGIARVGVLTVYCAEPVVLSTEQLANALSFVDAATTTLLAGQADIAEGLDAEHDLASNRSKLHQAQGMIMVQLGVGITEAMARLRAYAYAHDRRLGDVAGDIVERKIRLDNDR